MVIRFFKRFILLAFIISLLPSIQVSSQVTSEISPIDLSEKIMKVHSQFPNNFGDRGFGIYDWGEKKYKILNWKFDIVNTFPISIGEGPGEIKPLVYNAFIYKDKIYVQGYLERRINIYSKTGQFLNSIRLNFAPKDIILHHTNLYLFNPAGAFSTQSLFVQVMNIDTGKIIKEIRLQEPLPYQKELGNHFSSYLIRFDIGGDNRIYAIPHTDNTFFVIDENGKIMKRVELPHKPQIIITRMAKDDISMDTRDFYFDIKCTQDGLYFIFIRTEKDNRETKERVWKSHLINLGKNGKISEKVFDGMLNIIGTYKDTLYLFNREDYTAIPVKFFGITK